MKSFYLSGIFFLSSLLSISAQEKVDNIVKKNSFNQEQSSARSNYFLSLGLNVLDDGNSDLPFNTSEWSFKTPFFIRLERRSISSKFSAALSLSTNRLKVESVEKFYFSIDAAAHYYFDDYIFKNEDIETYVGLGLGRFFLDNNGNNTFNFSIGGRYWFSKNFGVSLQGNSKLGLKPKNATVLNHYAYDAGIVWRSTGPKKMPKEVSAKTPITLEESIIKDKELVVNLKEKIIRDKEEVVALKENFIKDKESLFAKINKVETVQDTTVVVLPLIETEIVDSPSSDIDLPVKTPTPFDFAGDWYVKITNSKDNSLIIDHSLYSTYTPFREDGTMWISDFKKGVWLQCKITVNLATGTFTAVEQPNIIDKGTVTITEGKFEKRTGISKAGNKVDKIYFKAQFSYDPDHLLIFEGHKSTGLEEDRY